MKRYFLCIAVFVFESVFVSYADNIIKPENFDRIIAVNHDDLKESDYIGTRQIYKKYGYNANFNFILTPFTSKSQQNEKVENVKELISDGNHLGLHAIMGSTFWWMNKMLDVRPDGTATFAPLLDEVKTDIGDGKNIFGYEVYNRKLSQMGFVSLPVDISDKMLDEITEKDFKMAIANYSFYFNKKTVTGLDLEGNERTWKYLQWLEYWYNELIDNSMGYSTTSESVDDQFVADYVIPDGGSLHDYYPDAVHLKNGKIVFFDDANNENFNNPDYQKVGYFRRGLFKGCASNCNYEVADLCIDIAKAFCKYYYGTDVFTNYGRHGVGYANYYWTDNEGFPFDDREKTVIAGEEGRFYHSHSQRFLTGHDLLLEKGIRMVTGPTNPRNPFLESQIGLYFGQSGIRSPYFNSSLIRNYLDLMGTSSTYTSTKISDELFRSFTINQDNLLKFFYENAGQKLINANGETVYIHNYFKEAIDHIRSCLGTGKIPSMSFDTIKDDISVLSAVDLLCQFCLYNGFKIVPFETARQAAVDNKRQVTENMFPNSDFDNCLLPLLDGESTSLDAYLPDGWNIDSKNKKGYSFTTEGRSKGDHLMNINNHSGDALTISTKIYGLPPGEYELSFYAKGKATIRLYLKKNSDFIDRFFGGRTRFTADETINITSKDNDYRLTFTIPETHVNDNSVNDYSNGSNLTNQYAHGYEDNISNVRFAISLDTGNDLSIGSLCLKLKGNNINAIESDLYKQKNNNNYSNYIYDLKGKRVKTLLKKGLYIKERKKFLIK